MAKSILYRCRNEYADECVGRGYGLGIAVRKRANSVMFTRVDH